MTDSSPPQPPDRPDPAVPATPSGLDPVSVPPPPPAPAGPSTGDQQTWSVLAHASALIQFVGIPSFVGPLVVWLMKKDDPVVRPHAREALNYQLALIIYFVGGIVLSLVALAVLNLAGIPILVVIGLFLMLLVVAEVVFAILASVAASKGQLYRYPMSLNLIK